MPRTTQADRSGATRTALVAAARRLFAERGYAAVPAETIVTEAGVSRGALYHHYADKRALFRAVLAELEEELTQRIAARTEGVTDVSMAMLAGVQSFLDACETPEMVRIALLDAPAVLGWQEWREVEAEHGLGLITLMLTEAMRQGMLDEQPVEPLAKLVLSAMIETALQIAHAEDRAVARGQGERALLTLLSGLLGRGAAG
jgi:AcrR family transcriptional regulator